MCPVKVYQNLVLFLGACGVLVTLSMVALTGIALILGELSFYPFHASEKGRMLDTSGITR